MKILRKSFIKYSDYRPLKLARVYLTIIWTQALNSNHIKTGFHIERLETMLPLKLTCFQRPSSSYQIKIYFKDPLYKVYPRDIISRETDFSIIIF